MFRFRRPRKPRAAFDMTPFLDVVFLLIIFFMLTATFAPRARVDVELPRASSANIVQETRDLVLTVDRHDRIRHGEKEMDAPALEELFRAESGREQQPDLVVLADRLASHGAVVGVMDRARRAGLKRFSVAVNPQEAGDHAAL